jgi:coproporphyrinogen III oxidase
MSLPHNGILTYNFQPKENSKEAKTLALLKKGVNWVD